MLSRLEARPCQEENDIFIVSEGTAIDGAENNCFESSLMPQKIRFHPHGEFRLTSITFWRRIQKNY